MAEKIKKGFFRVLPWSVAIVMIVSVSFGIWHGLPVNPAKAAALAPTSSVYLDANGDGRVDNVRLSFTDVTACTYEAGDWAVGVAGTINITAITGFTNSATCTTDEYIDVAVTASAGITGGVTSPRIDYTDAGTAGSVVADGNQDAANFTATDSAAPQISSATSTTGNGKYGPTSGINVTLNFTENVSSAAGLAVTLDTGSIVNTGVLTTQNTYSGTYTVGASGSGQTSSDLTISGVTGTIDDAAVNSNATPAVPAGSNIADSKAIVVDTTAPTVSAGNLTADESACTGTGGTCKIGDVITFTWNNAAGGDNNTDEGTVVSNLTNFGGGAAQALYDDGTNGDSSAGDDIYTYALTVPASNDDGVNTFTATVADNATNPNTTGPVTSGDTAPVDNVAPTVTAANISVTGATGTGGAFKNGDTAVPTWDNSVTGDNNSDTIVSVSFDAANFKTGDTALPGVNAANVWTASLTGPMTSQDDLSNNTTVTVTDNAGNVTTTSGTNDYTIDTIVPVFAAANPVVALLQGGGATTVPTRQWYYYDGKLLRIKVTNIAESDGNPLAGVRACLRSMKTDDQAETCDATEFGVAANYTALTVASATVSNSNYTLNAANLGALPTLKGGYPVNIELIDDAGNTALTSAAAETFVSVWNINPKDDDATINNATTTDWSTIADFTAVSSLVFNAQVAAVDVATYTFAGPLDLTDSATITGLQSFATNVTTSPSIMKIRSDNLPSFDAAATMMVKMSSAVQPGFAVKNNSGTVLGYIPSDAGLLSTYTIGGKTIDNFIWNAGAQTLTFDTTGFSEFDSDNTAPTVSTFSPANGAVGVATSADVVVTFSEAMDTSTLTYTLAPNPGGLSVVWSAGDTVATISHTAFNSATSYTFTVTAATDKVNNAATGTLATTFTTGGGWGGGGGGGAAPLTSITLGSPNGGETWAGGSSHNITWSSAGSTISKIKLFYSTDRGVNYPNTIAVDEMNDGTYSWSVPNISSSTVKIKVGGYDSGGNLVVADVSDGDFTINYTAPDVSADLSTVTASPSSVIADGVTQSTVTVTVKNNLGAAMSGKAVVLSGSRGALDGIVTVTGTTGSDGKATFKVSSATPGTSTFNASVGSTIITGTASVAFTALAEQLPVAEQPVAIEIGDLLKSSLSTSVYYYGSDNKRHLFPNEFTYKTWYSDWSGVKVVPPSQLRGIALGHNVTIRPGTVLVKIETDPKVYAVEPGGTLRWVPTETRAKALYGDTWAKKVVDVPLISWTDYTFGADITTDTHPTGCLVKYTGLTGTYYIQGSQKRLFSPVSAFDANHFKTANILTIPTKFYYAGGADISGAEPSLMLIY